MLNTKKLTKITSFKLIGLVIFTLFLIVICGSKTARAAEPAFLINWNASQEEVVDWANFQLDYYKSNNIGQDWLADAEIDVKEYIGTPTNGYNGKTVSVSHFSMLFNKEATTFHCIYEDKLMYTLIALIRVTAYNEAGEPVYNECIEEVEATLTAQMNNPKCIFIPMEDPMKRLLGSDKEIEGDFGEIHLMDDTTYVRVNFSVMEKSNMFSLSITLTDAKNLDFHRDPKMVEWIKEAFGRN